MPFGRTEASAEPSIDFAPLEHRGFRRVNHPVTMTADHPKDGDRPTGRQSTADGGVVRRIIFQTPFRLPMAAER